MSSYAPSVRRQIYTPGAGHMPPELTGRDELISSWELMLNRVQHGGRAGGVDTVLVGLRGVGKSVLLSRLSEVAARRGFDSLRLQGSAESSVVEALLQEASVRSARGESRWEAARNMLSQITGISLNIAGVGLGVDRKTATPAVTGQHPEPIAATLAELGHTIRAELGGGLVLSIDEFQMTRPEDIRLLGGVLNHLNTAHPTAPVVFVAGGLPSLPQRMVGPDLDHPYITNPERLFSFHTLPLQLPADAAALALTRPAERIGSSWEPAAVDAVLTATGGYPAHLQIYAATAWAQGAEADPVTEADVDHARDQAGSVIETQYLQPRWDRLTGHQQAYLTAIALYGDTAPTQAVAAILGTSITDQSRRRDLLLRRGEIFEPQRGRVQLSMPAMREYALRRYADTASADASLTTPSAMMANLQRWHDLQATRHETVDSFPESVITRKPDSPPFPPPLESS